MIVLLIILLFIALAAAVLGFSGVWVGMAGALQLVYLVALILALLLFVVGLTRW